MPTRYMFASYARQDADAVTRIVEGLRNEYRRRAIDVDVWLDLDKLQPGERWESVITRALRDSVGILVFVSPAAVQSEWVTRATRALAAAADLDRLIIPVILEPVADLPIALRGRQRLDVAGLSSPADLLRAANQIADATEAHLDRSSAQPPIDAAEAPTLAADLADEMRTVRPAHTDIARPPDSVFVAHGHDCAALNEVEAYLQELGVKPVILSKERVAAQSLLQKFFNLAGAARFAIVILSADDVGASRIQYEKKDVGRRALQFRARQNVLLELGFFYGLLGWEHVFVVQRPSEKVFPNFERPSDIEGAVFDSMDSSGRWRDLLADRLRQAGFRLTRAAPDGRVPSVGGRG